MFSKRSAVFVAFVTRPFEAMNFRTCTASSSNIFAKRASVLALLLVLLSSA